MEIQYFAEKSIRALPEFEWIEQQFPALEWLEDYQAFRGTTLNREKQCVVLARKRGAWLKPFHCYYHNKEYRYRSLDVAEGCCFDCVYCYLQSHLNHGALVLFVDLSSLALELQNAGPGLWISTGLLSDSLIAESQYPILPRISASIPEGSILEMRSKSADVTCLKDPSISRERVVISWSLNPETIARRYEYGAATLEKRLEAAREVIECGFRVGFHLDPVFYYDSWKEDYADLLRRIAEFPRERVAFLSLGLFRYTPDLKAAIRRRFPFHQILTGEFFPDADGKYHYFRGIRREMHRAFSEWLAPWREAVPVFWSMEPDPAIVVEGVTSL